MWLLIRKVDFGGCYVIILGHEIGMKKIQKYKIFVGTLVIRFKYLLRTIPGGDGVSLHTGVISFVIDIRSSSHLSISLDSSPGVISLKEPPSDPLPELGPRSPANSRAVQAALTLAAAGAFRSSIT